MTPLGVALAGTGVLVIVLGIIVAIDEVRATLRDLRKRLRFEKGIFR